MTETKMVPNVRAAPRFRFGIAIAREWLVQASKGQQPKDSSNESAGDLKPLARNSVYIVAEVETR